MGCPVRARILESAISDTTVHGLPRTIGSRHFLLRLAWAAVFLGLMVYTLTQLKESVAKLQSKPTSTSVETNSVPFEFPDIHICNPLIISPSYTATMSAADKEFVNKTVNQIADIIDRVQSPVSVYSLGKLFMSTVSYGFLSSRMGHRKEQTFIGAVLQPTTNNLQLNSSIIDLHHYSFLNCFTVKVVDSAALQLLKNLMAYLDLSLYLDATYRQNVKFYNGQLDVRGLGFVTYEPLLASGVRVFFTKRGSLPDEYSPSVHLSPGFSHHLSLRMRKVYLTPEKGKCTPVTAKMQTFDAATGDKMEYNYGITTCYATEMNSLFRGLNCYLPGYMPTLYAYRDMPACCNMSRFLDKSASNLTEAELQQIRALLGIASNVPDAMVNELNARIARCQNEKPCSETEYSIEHSSTLFPLDVTSKELGAIFENLTQARMSDGYSVPGRQWMLELFQAAGGGNATARDALIDAARANVLRIIVQPAESSSTQYTQAISYTFTDLLSSIGGLLGLFMGCSLLSLLETAELAGCLLIGRYSTWEADKETQRGEETQSDQSSQTWPRVGQRKVGDVAAASSSDELEKPA